MYRPLTTLPLQGRGWGLGQTWEIGENVNMQKYSYSLGVFLLINSITLAQLSNVPTAPTLLFPDSSDVLDNGCDPLENDIFWVFGWSEVPNATSYHLYAIGANALNPVIDNPNIKSTDYIHRSAGFIIDRNRMGWRWKVRAMVNGEWSNWSEEKVFDVEPLNIDCPQRDRTR